MTSTRNKMIFGAFIAFLIVAGILLPLVLQPSSEQREFQLEILSEFETSGFTLGVVIESDIAYLTVSQDGAAGKLVIVDVSDP
ncbi:MAG: hypothetical protein ACFFED_17280, partial [Candidatus Thorarchaeota archaeon]